jgi:hypothetical protein
MRHSLSQVRPRAEKSRSPRTGSTIDLDMSVAANLSNNPIADSLSGRMIGMIAGGSSRRRFQETDENKVARSDRSVHHWRL